jgi:hypothetical protein
LFIYHLGNKYKVTAVAAKPKTNALMEEIKEALARGEIGRRHNGNFFVITHIVVVNARQLHLSS